MNKLISITQTRFQKHGCPKCKSKNAHDFIVQNHSKLCVCYDCETTFGVSSTPSSTIAPPLAPLPTKDGLLVHINTG